MEVREVLAWTRELHFFALYKCPHLYSIARRFPY